MPKKCYKLPEPKDSLGYTRFEILQICRDTKTSSPLFWKAFGINTVAVGDDGGSRFYKCDVERTLFNLKKDGGKYYPWD